MISGYHKPKGLWYSFGTQWLSLFKDDEMSAGLDIKKNNFKLIIVNECKILKIKNVKEFDEFEKTYKYGYGIDWKKVYNNYDGIEIYNENNFQYLFDKKTNNWYKTWDIGSGCIWKNCKINAEKIEDEDIPKYIGDREENDGRKSSSRKRKSKSSSRKRKSSSKKRKR